MSIERSIKQFCPELESAGFNISALVEMMDTRYMGEFEIFLAASALFLDCYKEQLNDVKQAIESMDRKKIHDCAHKFKGAIGNFHDANVAEMARLIEVNSDSWTQEQFVIQFHKLNSDVTKFVSQLNQLVAGFSKIQTQAA
ncbi:Hpt domain-containing protein [Bdellovibrio sp. HCB185ZH]|uniref:Hpt domain-containing protein n=1 Tax=Bdellovibrio sp. HCB185ZH TaxID=3394235 RepID=UPI0039A4A13C